MSDLGHTHSRLRDEPIRARPLGPTGKVWRWCRRKPALAAAIAVIATLLLAVTVVSTVAAVRIATEVRRVEENARALRLNLYVSDMNVAYQAVADGNPKQARELLLKYFPSHEPNQTGRARQIERDAADDLRGWEWRYLLPQSQGDSRWTFRAHSNYVTCALFS